MNEENLLENAISKLLIEEREKKDIVIGSPHHTPGGIEKMPCPDHEAGDENAGLIAQRVAEMLNASSIIACNYHIDSNKSLGTDYSLQIIQWKAKYLIEIHGHSGKRKRCDDTCIEISSGNSEREKYSRQFAEGLKNKMDKFEVLKEKEYEIKWKFDDLVFKASSSATITTDLWIPFHIELPPSIRKGKDNKLPVLSDDFIICLKDTIDEVCL